MINRLKLTLDQAEYSALLNMAIGELRSPDDQLRYLLRTEAQRRGLLEAEQPYLQPKEGERDAASHA